MEVADEALAEIVRVGVQPGLQPEEEVVVAEGVGGGGGGVGEEVGGVGEGDGVHFSFY